MKTIFSIFCILLAFAQIARCQNEISTDKLDYLVKEALKKVPTTPGVAVAIVQGDKVYYTQAYGQADPEKNILATPNTPYYIASSTKSYVGLLAAILESEGKIQLDVPLTQYKPFKDFKDPALFKEVTIRDLLTHQSGLRNGLLTTIHAYIGNYTQADNLRILETETQSRKEGKTFRYDNLGYNILDVLLREELGKSWKELLKEKIFDPLGMTRTSAYMSDADKYNWGKAWPHISLRANNKPARIYLNKKDDMMHAAGGLITSAKDAANWLLLNINQGEFNGKTLYSKALLEATHKPYAFPKDDSRIFTQEGYGLGWSSGKYEGENVLYHFGGFAGFYSHISFLPDQKIGLAVFVNDGITGGRIANMLTAYVYKSFLGQAVDIEESLSTFTNVMASIKESIQSSFDSRAKRTWKLTQPLENYTGTYLHEDYGKLTISIKDGEPYVELAHFRCIATPFTRKNSIRVEFVPLSGEVIVFELDKKGTAEKALLDDVVFIREGS